MVSTLIVLMMAVLPASGAAAPRSGDITYTTEGRLNSCAAGPRYRVLDSKRGGKDGCRGTLKLQGVFWGCGFADANPERVGQFRQRLSADAETRCLELCAARAPGCEGRFKAPERCGLETTTEDSVELGKRLGCRRDCSGKDFNYCSLFDEGYLGDHPERVARQLPNCECVRVVRP